MDELPNDFCRNELGVVRVGREPTVEEPHHHDVVGAEIFDTIIAGESHIGSRASAVRTLEHRGFLLPGNPTKDSFLADQIMIGVRNLLPRNAGVPHAIAPVDLFTIFLGEREAYAAPEEDRAEELVKPLGFRNRDRAKRFFRSREDPVPRGVEHDAVERILRMGREIFDVIAVIRLPTSVDLDDLPELLRNLRRSRFRLRRCRNATHEDEK